MRYIRQIKLLFLSLSSAFLKRVELEFQTNCKTIMAMANERLNEKIYVSYF